MQIGTAARLNLAIVDGDPAMTYDDAKESSLVIPRPASHTGADRGGHPNRL